MAYCRFEIGSVYCMSEYKEESHESWKDDGAWLRVVMVEIVKYDWNGEQNSRCLINGELDDRERDAVAYTSG
jgi:hypothetical protein